jgi:hypothetical protein
MVFTLVTAVVPLAGVYYVMLEDRWSPDDENSDSARVGYARLTLNPGGHDNDRGGNPM